MHICTLQKSMPMDCQGLSGTGRPCSKPFGLLLPSLAAAHAPHDVQNTAMSCAIDIHQKYLLMYCAVLNWLKWPIIVCA